MFDLSISLDSEEITRLLLRKSVEKYGELDKPLEYLP